MAHLANIGILSIGEMGLGVAKLLIAHKYRVISNVSDRSKYTQTRAEQASIDLVPNDAELVSQADYILSIVPPRDAIATAQRILTAWQNSKQPIQEKPLHYLDLNAVSPASARKIGDLFSGTSIRFIDGGIIGGPPKPKQDDGSNAAEDGSSWTRPSIPLSGPHELPSSSTPSLLQILNAKHISPLIGSASGLKMCFASLTKGLTALAIQSFSTAKQLDCLEELREHLELYSPKTGALTGNSVVNMPPKAYRWVAEMEEIAATFREDGGWVGKSIEDGQERAPADIFGGIAEVYRIVAEETVLGEEKTGNRKRGKTVDDIADALVEGLRSDKKRRVD